MCQAKPGPRCVADTTRLAALRDKQYAQALLATANDESATAHARLEASSRELWLARLEVAGADPSTTRDPWARHAGEALAQARAEQAALMPERPSNDAPARLRVAYEKLASTRDDLARADAIATADALATRTGAPTHGPRPNYEHADERVAAAEYEYAAAANARSEGVGTWTHLLTRGQMPYAPFHFNDHPNASMAAPWVRHHRGCAPVDMQTVRRCTGFGDDVTWDPQRSAVVVTIDPEGYLDDDEREHTLEGVEHSLWQLGFHTERGDSARLLLSRSPDVPAWRKSTTAPARKKVAA